MFNRQIYMNEKIFLKLENDINLSSSFARDIANSMKTIKY